MFGGFTSTSSPRHFPGALGGLQLPPDPQLLLFLAWPKINAPIFFLYYPLHPPIKFCRNTSKGPYHYKDNSCISQFPQFSDLFLQILVLFHFFFFFFLYYYIRWYSNINNYPLLFSFLSITTGSGRLGSIRLSHWIFVSHSTLISSFSTAPSGACSYHFSLCCNPFFLQISQWTFFETLLCVAFCILFEPIFHIRLLCVAHFQLFSHIIYTGGFHWCDQCGTSCSLSWLPAPVHHTTMLLFQPLNHLLITITTFFPYQLSLSFPWWIVSAFVFHSTFLLVFLLCFLNSTVDIVSLILIVSAPDTPLIRFYY